jgi:hypothetical protein
MRRKQRLVGVYVTILILYMGYKEYSRDKKLILDSKVYITRDVWKILNRYYRKERKQNGQISKSKIVCNLIIKHLQ